MQRLLICAGEEIRIDGRGLVVRSVECPNIGIVAAVAAGARAAASAAGAGQNAVAEGGEAVEDTHGSILHLEHQRLAVRIEVDLGLLVHRNSLLFAPDHVINLLAYLVGLLLILALALCQLRFISSHDLFSLVMFLHGKKGNVNNNNVEFPKEEEYQISLTVCR